MASEKELMGASTTLLVLALLNEQPSYGYELVQRLSAQANDLFEWQEGTVYPVLHRLKKDGLVRDQWQDADANKLNSGAARRRKYYYITAKGRKALVEQSAQWNAFHQIITKATAKISPLAS